MYIVELKESSRRYRNEKIAQMEQQAILDAGGKIYESDGRFHKSGIYGVFETTPPDFFKAKEIPYFNFAESFHEIGRNAVFKKLRRKIEEYLRKKATPEDLIFWAYIAGFQAEEIPDIEIDYDYGFYLRAAKLIPSESLQTKKRSITLNMMDEPTRISEEELLEVKRIFKKMVLLSHALTTDAR